MLRRKRPATPEHAARHPFPSRRAWVFAAATTNVEYTITVTVTDTDTDSSTAPRVYFKPLGPPAPAITDTEAFATCS